MRFKIQYILIKTLYNTINAFHSIFKKNRILKEKKISLGAFLVMLISMNSACSQEHNNNNNKIICYAPLPDTTTIHKDTLNNNGNSSIQNIQKDSTGKPIKPTRTCYSVPNNQKTCYKRIDPKKERK